MFNRLKNGIFWDESLNLVLGCTPVMPNGKDQSGCRGCWSASETRMRQHHPNDKIRERATGLITPTGHYNGTIRLNWQAIEKPLRTKKETAFSIWTDIFHPDVPLDFIDAVIGMIRACPQHIYLAVTKRPELAIEKLYRVTDERPVRGLRVNDYLQNLWVLGTTENQQAAESRLPHLLRLKQCGWPVVGILAEPFLGAIDILKACDITIGNEVPAVDELKNWLDIIICGGESGHDPRPTHPRWVRSLRDQSTSHDIPFMFKGWDAWRPATSDDNLTANHAAWVDDDGKLHPLTDGTRARTGADNLTFDKEVPGQPILMRKCGRKKDAGRKLDTREWEQLPGRR